MQTDIDPSDLVTNNITTTMIKSRPSYFTIIVRPYTFAEQFKDSWDTYGDFISLIAGGFIAGVAALVLSSIRNRKKKPYANLYDGW